MSAIRIAVKRLPERLRGFDRPDPEDLLHAGRVSVWVRWFLLGAALVDSNYRIDYGAPSHIFNTGYVLGIMAVNGYVQYLIQRNGTAKPVWLFGLSAMDLAFISFSTSLSGGFSSPYFPAYYFVVVMFAWVFSSPGLTLSWTTLVVVVYSVLSVTVEPGISILDKDERVLFFRVVSLFAVAGSISIIGFERSRRRRGLEREQELHRQIISISQAIHDTTAQWAYMVGLGVEGAMELVDSSNDKLRAKLQLTADMSKSAMWDLRHPIDGGQIFRGEELGEVLEAHAATFSAISSAHAEVVCHGAEIPLSTITRSLLFSIAHNALTNVIRHARARAAVIDLEYADDELRLSVSDDGIGLPQDYEARGHGFRNMRADAERMGGSLEVKSRAADGGTTVTCRIPYEELDGEE